MTLNSNSHTAPNSNPVLGRAIQKAKGTKPALEVETGRGEGSESKS